MGIEGEGETRGGDEEDNGGKRMRATHIDVVVDEDKPV